MQTFVTGHRVNDLRDQLPIRNGAECYPWRPPTAINAVVVHYSGVDADSSAESIARYQTDKTDGDLFPAIAYHFVVRQSGLIEQCHDLDRRTWHAGALANQTALAICLPMLYGPKVPQAAACGCLIAALGQQLGRNLTIKGHCDYMATACPGQYWPEWKRTIAPSYNAPPRELVIDGIAIKWAFFDAYRKIETLHPGLLGKPTQPHGPGPLPGTTSQQFEHGAILWSGQAGTWYKLSN